MMKILMVLESDFPPDERVENEIKVLLSLGYEVGIVCYNRKDAPARDRYLSALIFRIKISKPLIKLSALALTIPLYFSFWKKHLIILRDEYKYDLLHVHDLPLISVGYKIARLFGIPIISDLHENRPEIMKMYKHVTSFPGKYLISIKRWQRFQQKYTKLVDKVILVTEDAKRYYVSNYRLQQEKIAVFPNYVNLETMKKIKTDQELSKKYRGKVMIVYIGETGFRRGTFTIIEAAKLLFEQEEIHFVIVGKSKDQHQLRKMIRDIGLENVELTGWLPFEKTMSYVKAAKMGLSPLLRNIHHDTTYANKLFQYMAFSKPVIVSDCPAQAKIVKREKCGLVFKAGDASDLANKVLKLLDQKKRGRLAVNARKAVRQRYNFEEAAVGLEELYREFDLSV